MLCYVQKDYVAYALQHTAFDSSAEMWRKKMIFHMPGRLIVCVHVTHKISQEVGMFHIKLI